MIRILKRETDYIFENVEVFYDEEKYFKYVNEFFTYQDNLNVKNKNLKDWISRLRNINT